MTYLPGPLLVFLGSCCLWLEWVLFRGWRRTRQETQVLIETYLFDVLFQLSAKDADEVLATQAGRQRMRKILRESPLPPRYPRAFYRVITKVGLHRSRLADLYPKKVDA